MNKLLIHHHLGLGDHLICNGLVRTLARQHTIQLFCKYQNFSNVQLMYQDHPDINIISIKNDEEAMGIGVDHPNYMRLGIALNPGISNDYEPWDQAFYSQAAIPFDNSWSVFAYNKPTEQNISVNQPYAFLCNAGSDGLDGLDYSVIRSDLHHTYSHSGGFFNNIELIYNATEIHCINSAYIHLIDRLQKLPSQTKLFYHKHFKPKPFSNFTLKQHWITI